MSSVKCPLNKYLSDDPTIYEIGVDEAGRGPLFGRVYSAAVVLPKDDTFNHAIMKDSKKFTSKKKIEQAAEHIRENAVAWYVGFEDEKTIDDINILQATQKSMHECVQKVRRQLKDHKTEEGKTEWTDYRFHLLIDGNYFNPIHVINNTTDKMETIPYDMFKGGDNKYTCIAAASILAKVERDKYIEELCIENPELAERYGIDRNKGYGAKKHIEGIQQYGISKWHRKSFGICKQY